MRDQHIDVDVWKGKSSCGGDRMSDKQHYMRIFKIAGINLAFANEVCNLLSDETLDRITRVGFDRRLIKPVIEKAWLYDGGINDENINAIMNNQDLIIRMKLQYCKRIDDLLG